MTLLFLVNAGLCAFNSLAVLDGSGGGLGLFVALMNAFACGSLLIAMME